MSVAPDPAARAASAVPKAGLVRPRPGRRAAQGPRKLVSRHERPEQIAVENEAREVLERAAEAVDIDRDAEVAWPPYGLDSLERALADAIAAAIADLHDSDTPRRRHTALIELVLELEKMRGRLRERRLAQRVEAVAAVQETLGRLRTVGDLPTLLSQVPKAICEACGLERGVLSRVTGSEWTVEGAYFDGEDEWAADFVEVGQKHRAQLNHLLLETEMIRRRTPALVLDAQNNPLAHRPLVTYADVRAYVSAPIMPAAQVIGFVHGDYYFSGHDVDSLDRDTLWAFAQGFASIYERAVLHERLHTQRNRMRQLLSSADAVMTELTEAGVSFSSAEDRGSADMARSAAAMFPVPESRIEALITRRELEVLGLMAGGATNAEIAQQLVIAEGTVKSHVKHILRKLRAANRAEAVSRYLHLSFRGDPGGGELPMT